MNSCKFVKHFLLVLILSIIEVPLFSLPSLRLGQKATGTPVTSGDAEAVVISPATTNTMITTQPELTLQAITALRDISRSNSEQILMLDERITGFTESFKQDLDAERRVRRRDEVIAGVIVSVPIIIVVSCITYSVVSGTR